MPYLIFMGLSGLMSHDEEKQMMWPSSDRIFTSLYRTENDVETWWGKTCKITLFKLHVIYFIIISSRIYPYFILTDLLRQTNNFSNYISYIHHRVVEIFTLCFFLFKYIRHTLLRACTDRKIMYEFSSSQKWRSAGCLAGGGNRRDFIANSCQSQIGLVSAHFFKVFFESYWLLGYSVIRSEPPKKFKPQGFQYFDER